GWPSARIRVIDEDQGKSGASPNSREGFLELVSLVANREVGIVISLELSRLARNNPDWSQIIYMCRYTGTLLADEHGIYDPADGGERMMLNVRGQVSELERDNSVHRMVEARWSKARRGELHYAPPAGYDIDDSGRLVMSCDETVIDAIQMVFRKFEELGSARQVFAWWQEQGRRFPVRQAKGKSHPIDWRDPLYAMFLRTLQHPMFAGAYVFGRTELVRELDPDDPSRLKAKRMQRKEWPVLIQDHHDGYISFERFLEIQEQIKGNKAMGRDTESTASPAREGKALLQGLVRCGKCARMMNVSYGGGSRSVPSPTMQYRCGAARRRALGPECQIIGGIRIDQVVMGEFLEVARPAAVEAAQRAEDVVRRECNETNRYWQLQVEKLKYEADRAERQFHAVEPENRVVVRPLEQRWNERLIELEEVREKAKVAQQQSDTLTASELQRVSRLGADLQAVWDAATTTPRDKKRLLRCAIEEVQLTTEESRYLVRIVWKGGATADHYVARRRGGIPATSEETVNLVRKLAKELDDAQIARVLNRQGRKSGRGIAFTKTSVLSMRGKNRIPVCPQKPAVDPQHGPFTADEVAAELKVCTSTIHRWLRDGVLAGEQVTPGAPWRITLTDEVRKRLTGGEAPDGWVGLKDASAMLGISKQRVAYLVNTGKLKATRASVGKRKCWRIDLGSAGPEACAKQATLFDQMHNDDIRGS
ncbi:MAG: recombinase family protein, partial [bacterium]|nr:recombinase family protein [bacterium]